VINLKSARRGLIEKHRSGEERGKEARTSVSVLRALPPTRAAFKTWRPSAGQETKLGVQSIPPEAGPSSEQPLRLAHTHTHTHTHTHSVEVNRSSEHTETIRGETLCVVWFDRT